jgi:hypothetical protein
MSRSAINPVAFGISREAIREGLNTLVVGGRAYDVRKSTYPSSSNSTFTVGSLGPARKYVSGNATADRYSAPHLQVAGSRPGSLLCVWSPLTLNAADRYLLTSGLTLSTAGSGLSISTTKTAARAVNSSYVNVEVYTDAPTIGSTYVSVLTAGAYLRLYHFGRLIGEAAIAGGAPRTTTAAKTISIGSTDASTSNYVGANIFLAAEFDAEIPAAYALSLSQDPWQILTAPPRKKGLVFGADLGSGGGLSASGAAAAAGSATLQADVALAGVAVAVAGGAADAQIFVPLSATGFSVSAGSAGLTATITVSAAGLAEAAGAAGLSASVLLAGAAAATAAGNASLAATLAAAASGSAQAGGSATLSGGSPGALSAAGSATAGGLAGLDVQVSLSAAGSAAAGGSALLGGGAAGSLSASGAAQAGGSGLLTASVVLTAAGFVQAMGAGALFVSIDLAASGQATAGGLAHLALQGTTLLAIDPRYRVRLQPREFLAAWSRPPYSVTLQ